MWIQAERKPDHVVRSDLSNLEEADILEQTSFDVFVVKKLREDNKFLSQKLISKIDCCIHYPCAMSSNGIGDMCYIDGIDSLVGTSGLQYVLLEWIGA